MVVYPYFVHEAHKRVHLFNTEPLMVAKVGNSGVYHSEGPLPSIASDPNPLLTDCIGNTDDTDITDVSWNLHIVDFTMWSAAYQLSDSSNELLRGINPLLSRDILKRTPMRPVVVSVASTVLKAVIAAKNSGELNECMQMCALSVDSCAESVCLIQEHAGEKHSFEFDCILFSGDTHDDELVDGDKIAVTMKDVKQSQLADPIISMWGKLVDQLVLVDEAVDQPLSDTAVSQQQTTYHGLVNQSIHKFDKRIVKYHLHIHRGDDGILYFAAANKQYPVPVVTSKLGGKIIHLTHDNYTSVHLGRSKMLEYIRLRWWWSSMEKDVRDHIKDCLSCSRNKFTARPGYGMMHLRFYDHPGSSISIDIVVLHYKTECGARYLFTILDNFSHYAGAYCMPDMEAATCASKLFLWVVVHGVPGDVRSDRGNNLNISEIFKSLYALFGIKKILSHPWAPQGNAVERFHRWLASAFRSLFQLHDVGIDESIHIVLWIFNSAQCRVTGYSPNLLQMGRELRFPLDVFEGKKASVSKEEFVQHLQEIMPRLWESARASQMIEQEKSATYYNEHHHVQGSSTITQGSYCFKEAHTVNSAKIPAKILPKCTGPWKVLRVSSGGALIQHAYSAKKQSVSLRHIRSANVSSAIEENSQSTAFEAGELIFVKMVGANASDRKFHMCKLLDSEDGETWNVQWYNTNCKLGDNLLTAQWLPSWSNSSGVEKFHAKSPVGYTATQYVVHKRRFLPPTFQLDKARMPAEVRSMLKSKFRTDYLVQS